MISPFAAIVLSIMAVLAPGHRRPPSCDAMRFCRCISASIQGLTPQELTLRHRDRADAVVLGTVTHVDTLAGVRLGGLKDGIRVRPIVARLRVERAWRGADTDTISVAYGSLEGQSSCDILLVPGQSYALFAQLGERGMLWTRQCMGTVPVADADSVLAALGPSRRPRA